MDGVEVVTNGSQSYIAVKKGGREEIQSDMVIWMLFERMVMLRQSWIREKKEFNFIFVVFNACSPLFELLTKFLLHEHSGASKGFLSLSLSPTLKR